MKIQDSNTTRSPFKQIKDELNRTRLFKLFVFCTVFFGFGLGCIVYGGYLNKTRQNIKVGKLLINLAEFNFSFIPNKVNSLTTKVERFEMDIKFINLEKLRYHRQVALKRGRITETEQEAVPARIRYNGKNYRVDISLTGLTNMHIGDPNKWSLSVKVKKGETIMGMRKFALLVPRSRGYLTDWIATTVLKARGGIGIRNDFIDMNINGDELGLFYLEERFDKRLIENNERREGIIFKIQQDQLSVYGMSKIQANKELMEQYVLLHRLWHSFLNDKVEASSFFDLKKFATFAVVSDILNAKHALRFANIRFYFNPITGLCEPIGREWEYLQRPFKNRFITLFDKHKVSMLVEPPTNEKSPHFAILNNPIYKRICNLEFKEYYLQEAEELSQATYFDSLLYADKSLDLLLRKVHKENPFYEFPIQQIHKNQKYVRQKIHPHQSLMAAFKQLQGDSVTLLFENKIDLPVEIHYFSYNEGKTIVPGKRLIIEPQVSLPHPSLVQLQLSPNIDLSTFSPDSLAVHYTILGLKYNKKVLVFPAEMEEKAYAELNYPRQAANLEEFDFLSIDEATKTIEFSSPYCRIAKDLIIPGGYTVSMKSGSQIDLLNEARIISHSPFLFFGQPNDPLLITSTDSTGQGIVVYGCNTLSEFSYVQFENLSNISDDGWDLRGAITFYESPVNIDHCTFRNNVRGDDFLNIVRTEFKLQHTTFENTVADAFDADFCHGTIEEVEFLQIGNDAVDVSGTTLRIAEVNIVNPADKGISAGEGSHIICSNITIKGGEIAIASKDNSTIEINGVDIFGSKLAYSAFQKKSEFGPGVIKVDNSNMQNIGTAYLIEDGSSLSIGGRKIDISSQKVRDKLYGAEFGKSSK